MGVNGGRVNSYFVVDEEGLVSYKMMASSWLQGTGVILMMFMFENGLSSPTFQPAQRAVSPQLLTELVTRVEKLEADHVNDETRLANLERRVNQLESSSDSSNTDTDTNTILLVGGISGSGPDSDAVSSITVLGAPDCQVSPLGVNLFSPDSATITIGQESYPLLCGGTLFPRRDDSTVCYTLSGRDWVEHSQMTRERSQFSMVSVPTGVYSLGGHDGASRIGDFLPAGASSWQQGTPINGNYRQGLVGGCAAVIDDTHIMMAGGDLDSRQVRKYDITNDEWTFWPDLPFGVQWHACIRTPEGILLTGGQRGRLGVSAETHLIDLSTGQAQQVGSMNGPRRAHRLVEYNGAVLAIGGGDENGEIHRIEQWVPETKSWITKSMTLPEGRSFFAAVNVPIPSSEFCA